MELQKRHKRKTQGERVEKLQQYGIDLPDLPGIPADVIPIHIHAIKTIAKLFTPRNDGRYVNEPFRWRLSTDTHCSTGNYDEHVNTKREIPAVGTSVAKTATIESLFENETVHESLTSQRNDLHREELWKKCTEAVQSWLNGIHRCVRDATRTGGGGDANGPVSDQKRSTAHNSVPVAIMKHLEEVGLDHHRMAVRRSSLYLMGRLLEKSAECRQYLFDEKLLPWMDAVLSGQVSTTLHSGHPTSTSTTTTELLLWQQEAFSLLQYMNAKGYGTLYPTLPVAILRFHQFCPMATLSVSKDSGFLVDEPMYNHRTRRSMIEWRQLRDSAIAQCNCKFSQRLDRVLSQIQKEMEVIVPRMDGKSNFPNVHDDRKAKVNERCSSRGDHDNRSDDDEDSVGWEDGMDEVVEDCDPASHVAAVERTMEAIRGVGVIHEGGLLIDLGRSTDMEASTETSRRARERLIQLARVLKDKYMSRLSGWVEGLTNADTLRERSPQVLMQMSKEELASRKDVLDRILFFKGEINSLLARLKRLGIIGASNRTEVIATSTSDVSPSATSMARRATLKVTDLTSDRDIIHVSTTLRKRLASTQSEKRNKRSNRIPIRYAKR